MNDKDIRIKLHCIVQNEPNSIKAIVAKEALARSDIKSFFLNLEKQGCISSMITSLNYYEQTHKFFDHYYDEIEQIRINSQKQRNLFLETSFDLKTSLAWFAFEQTALCITQELNIFERDL